MFFSSSVAGELVVMLRLEIRSRRLMAKPLYLATPTSLLEVGNRQGRVLGGAALYFRSGTTTVPKTRGPCSGWARGGSRAGMKCGVASDPGTAGYQLLARSLRKKGTSVQGLVGGSRFSDDPRHPYPTIPGPPGVRNPPIVASFRLFGTTLTTTTVIPRLPPPPPCPTSRATAA